MGEVAQLAGTTVRTLHHYDEIGLVRPRGRTPAGYRLYEHEDLERLQQVLAYRELGMSLDEVAAVLAGDTDPTAALARQHALLLDRIAQLQATADRVRRTWEARTMGTQADPEGMFAAEAEERWGDTEAWRESQRRTSAYGPEDWAAIRAEAAQIEQRLADLQRAGEPATGDAAVAAAEEHRQHISRWFYACPREVHRALGQMYVADERFTAHYEQVAPGLAAYVSAAVEANADRV